MHDLCSMNGFGYICSDQITTKKPLEKWNSFTELQIKFLNVDALRTCSDSSKNHSSDMKDV